MDGTVAAQLADYLLQIKAIQLNTQIPFTWTSGWKSPMYCDNRKLLSYPEVRNFVKNGLVDLVGAHFKDATCIAGVATAGIPLGTLVADKLELPFIYVRAKPKEHGLRNTIEGELPKNAKVVVVEDTISTGKSSLQAVDDLRYAGANVIGMVAIYSYTFPATIRKFEEAGVRLKTLTQYDALLNVALKNGTIPAEAIDTLSSWREDPSKWNVIQ